MQRSLTFVLFAVVSVLLTSQASAEDWPMWRGPRGDGISQDSNVPTTWSPTENIAWKAKLPGRGLSSPIVVGNAVYLTASLEASGERVLIRINALDGNMVWQTVVHAGKPENQHKFNTSASSTPVSDGKHIFCVFVDDEKMVVAAVDRDGQVVWKQSPGAYFSKHGFAASPVLCPFGLLINGHQDGKAFVVMLDPETGSERWRYQPEIDQRSFSTPVVLPEDETGRQQIILCGANRTLALDPESGSVVWFTEGPTEKVVCTPSGGQGMVFAFGGSPETKAFAVRLGGRGDVSQTHIEWRRERAMPYVPSPLLYGDCLHVIDDAGIYSCLDPASGNALTQKRRGGNTYSSPVGVGDRVYLFEDSGRCTVIENEPGFQVVAVNELGEMVQTTPAISEGSLFVRGEEHLFRIGVKHSQSGAIASP
ncbi:MAG: PQQ-binding-like beta-propeller repeat protein [Pirellula sp.]